MLSPTEPDTSNPPADQFTAARIAEVLGRDVRDVRREVESRDGDGHVVVGGNVARTYLVSSLPDTLRLPLAQLAERRGYDCPERMLTREGAFWVHRLPIAEIHGEEITRAQKRAEALAPWARARSQGTRPLVEIREGAALAFRQTLGYEVGADTLDALMRSAIQRNGGRGEFGRWDLYLPENPKRATRADAPISEEVMQRSDDFTQFETYLAGLNAVTPSVEDRSFAWTAMCDNLLMLRERGENPRKARRRLVNHVFERAPWLCTSKPSLSKCFEGKWVRYCGGQSCMIRDRRATKSGNRHALPLTEEDKHKLIARAVEGGGLAAAWRQLLGAGELSPAVLARYATNCARKSYVPNRISELLSPLIAMVEDMHHGPRTAKLNGAYITRDWSGVLPGDWYQGDDCTLPVYYWEHGPDGQTRAIRGQCLVMIDCRTMRVLAFALHSEKNYNARVIRGLILATHDVYGLPRRGFYFEQGMWKSSRIVTGGEQSDELTPGETETGLRDFGVEFKHARLPRAKLVERVLGLLQSRMEDQPGYCGRNEQTEKFERLQRKLLDARAGKIEFQSFLLHRDVWAKQLTEICDEYNGERQDGRLLAGSTPREFWDARFDFDKPLVRLTDGLRHLLANHRRPVRVTANGLRIQSGKEVKWFRNEATGALRGRTVQCYFNPEDLSSVWIRPSDDATDTIVVPCAPEPAAMDANEVELSYALASCCAHNRAASTLYATIATHFKKSAKSHFRLNVVAPEFVEQSREVRAQQEGIRAAQASARIEAKQVTQARRQLGNPTGSELVSNRRLLESARLEKEAMQDGDT
jgi:hypothetical protein